MHFSTLTGGARRLAVQQIDDSKGLPYEENHPMKRRGLLRANRSIGGYFYEAWESGRARRRGGGCRGSLAFLPPRAPAGVWINRRGVSGGGWVKRGGGGGWINRGGAAGGSMAVAAVGSTGAAGAEAVGSIAGKRLAWNQSRAAGNESHWFSCGLIWRKNSGNGPFVVIVRSGTNWAWLHERPSALQWLPSRGSPGRSGGVGVRSSGGRRRSSRCRPLLRQEAKFSFYRLVDVRAVRDVRVSMPARPGFLKAVRLAASLGLPVRLLPGQPSAETLGILPRLWPFISTIPWLKLPIEFFHSALAWMLGTRKPAHCGSSSKKTRRFFDATTRKDPCRTILCGSTSRD